jgi:hypothetical protein
MKGRGKEGRTGKGYWGRHPSRCLKGGSREGRKNYMTEEIHDERTEERKDGRKDGKTPLIGIDGEGTVGVGVEARP